MSSAVPKAQATRSTSANLLRLLGSVAGRLAQDEHPLQFIDGVFGELAGPLALNAYLYYQVDAGGDALSLLAYRGIEEVVAKAEKMAADA